MSLAHYESSGGRSIRTRSPAHDGEIVVAGAEGTAAEASNIWIRRHAAPRPSSRA
jgi:hypothetical protein